MAEVTPIKLKYDDGKEYVLEFNAQTVSEAERAGFLYGEVANKPMTMIPLLFFYAFKMHHPSISKAKTDSILWEDLGGINEAMQVRLVELYLAPIEGLSGEDTPKNARLTVEI